MKDSYADVVTVVCADALWASEAQKNINLKEHYAMVASGQPEGALTRRLLVGNLKEHYATVASGQPEGALKRDEGYG